MDNNKYPKMPEDWFPDEGILVIAKNGTDELGFAITRQSYFGDLYKQQMEPSLKALRMALYQSRYWNNEERINIGLKESPLQTTDGSMSCQQRT